MKRNKRILLVGYYGADNFGDDLFIKTADSSFEGVDVGALSCSLNKVNKITNIKFLIPCLLRGLIFKKYIGIFVKTLFLLLNIYRYRNVVFWGGTLFSTQSVGVLHLVIYMLEKAGFIETYGFGISIGPFEEENWRKELGLKLIEGMKYVSVRDRRSFRMLSSANNIHGEYGADIAMLYASKKRDFRSVQSNKYIAVSLISLQNIDYEEISTIAKENNVSVKILCLNTHRDHGDKAVSIGLKEHCELNNINSEYIGAEVSVDSIVDIVAGAERVISERLHGVIIGYLCGVNTKHVPYHRKCIDFVDDINEIGLLEMQSSAKKCLKNLKDAISR